MVFLQDLRMEVQEGMGHEQWEWLQDRGFREVTHDPDRRQYRDLLPSLVRQFVTAPHEAWRSLLIEAMEEAWTRPRVDTGSRPVEAEK